MMNPSNLSSLLSRRRQLVSSLFMVIVIVWCCISLKTVQMDSASSTLDEKARMFGAIENNQPDIVFTGRKSLAAMADERALKFLPESVEEKEKREDKNRPKRLSIDTSPWIFRPEDYSDEKVDRSKTKYLMMYTHWKELNLPREKQKHEFEVRSCRYSCEWTNNITKTDVLIFEAYDLKDHPLSKRPPRTPNQLWFFWTNDPVTTDFGLDNDLSRGLFNITSSYRGESDIPDRLGYITRKTDPIPDTDYRAIFRNKTKFGAWFVSNCKTKSKREIYVWRMSKVAKIDVFGLCGPYKCGQNHDRMSYDVPSCFPMLTHDYKFYLAFENSFCDQYVSEKFFKMFFSGLHVVPVVRGGVDYNNAFPKEAFVNADDFDSPEKLTQYLLDLGENEEEYVKMLKAKDRWMLSETHHTRLTCKLCEYLHTHSHDTKIIPDVYKEYIGPPGQCRPPTDLGPDPLPDLDIRHLMNYTREETDFFL